MIQFFRRIRQQLLSQNRFSKYILYALGEIVLVVLGILIALQINNWNEHRKQNNLIKTYMSSLLVELEDDIKQMELRIEQSKTSAMRIDSLVSYVRGKKIEDISNLDVLILGSGGYRPHQWNRATIDILKSSGLLQKVTLDSIGKRIAEYNSFTYHLDEDFKADNASWENVSQLKSRIINYNYKNLKALQKDYRGYENDLKGMEFFEEASYKLARQENLRLMTDDINELNEIINELIKIEIILSVRIEIEFKRVIQEAESLITSIRDNLLK